MTRLKKKIESLVFIGEVSYRDLLLLVRILVNDEFVFFNVIEDIFRELFFNKQESKECTRSRLIGLTNIISSICRLNS